MRKGAGRVLIVAAITALAACSKSDRPAGEAGLLRSAAAPAPAAAMVLKSAGADVRADLPLRRYLAVRHVMQLRTEANVVEGAWRAANEACAAADCEVLASTLERDDDRAPAEARLEMRIAPEKFDAFLARVSALGTVGRHERVAEDKTDEVVDVDARLKNMTEFRDRLRQLLATPGAKLKDLVEVERELARVQTDLDSLASRRKALASQTEKVHVIVMFSARSAVLSNSAWLPVRDALMGAGQVLATSLATLISLFVAVLPWAALLMAAAIAVRAGWRRRRPR